MDFTGKVVIITGASSGIGAASAKLLATYNAVLTLVGRHEQRLREIADICESTKGISPLVVRLDLTDEGSCEEVVNRTVATFGRIDVLLNCAGKAGMSSLFDEDISCLDELYKIILRVPYKLTHLALPHLTKTKGNIVNIRAAQFQIVRHGFLSYSIMNAAIETFTKAAAVDIASTGVRVNTVSIGFTNTNLLENFNYDKDEKEIIYRMLEKEHLVSILQPEEVAKTIAFVASNLAPNVHGANLYIDNGASFKQ